jgi:hypothetical protein
MWAAGCHPNKDSNADRDHDQDIGQEHVDRSRECDRLRLEIYRLTTRKSTVAMTRKSAPRVT